jgi:hypothetical protein
MRLINFIRFRLCFGAAPIDRTTGEYTKPELDTAEPERTERLLQQPFALFPSNASDAYEAINMFCIARATGLSFWTFAYDTLLFVGAQLLALTFGLEELAKREGVETQQAFLVLFLQWGMFVYILCLRPSIDRIENAQSGLQFAAEGLATFLLLLPALMDYPVESAGAVSFLVSLTAVGIPMFMIIYDSFFCPLLATALAAGGIVACIAGTLTTCMENIQAIPGCALCPDSVATTCHVDKTN